MSFVPSGKTTTKKWIKKINKQKYTRIHEVMVLRSLSRKTRVHVSHKVNVMAAGNLGPVSISDKTSYRKISQSLEAARFVFRFVRSLWNLTGTSTALLLMCQSNFKAIRIFQHPISHIRVFTRSHDKTSYRILKRGPDSLRSNVKVLSYMPCKIPFPAGGTWPI